MKKSALLLLALAVVSCKSNVSGTAGVAANQEKVVTTNQDNEDMNDFDVTILSDSISEDGFRRVSVATSEMVCSSQIDIVLDGELIREVKYIGGCNGNLKGIGSLVAGMKVQDVISRLEGTDCSGRGTSCPDQLARALKKLVQ